MKEWITVLEHSGRSIQILNGAGADDSIGYRIEPPLSAGTIYTTVGDAVDEIEKQNTQK